MPPDRWPEPVQQARSMPYASEGAAWLADRLPLQYRPSVPPPPVGRETAAADLCAFPPQGRANGRVRNGDQEAHDAPGSTPLPDDDRFDDDEIHEECGVFGIWNHPDAAAVTALGLHALQHRGQEATGIVSFDGAHFHSHRGLGLVGDNFSDARVIASLAGTRAVGHNRYATTGDTVLRNVQPLYADFEFGGFAVAHNGNLTNATASAARWCGAAACSSPPPTARSSSTSSPSACIPPWSTG